MPEQDAATGATDNGGGGGGGRVKKRSESGFQQRKQDSAGSGNRSSVCSSHIRDIAGTEKGEKLQLGNNRYTAGGRLLSIIGRLLAPLLAELRCRVLQFALILRSRTIWVPDGLWSAIEQGRRRRMDMER